LRQSVFEEVREEFKERWREHYKEAAQQREELELAARAAGQGAAEMARSGQFDEALKLIEGRDRWQEFAEEALEEKRDALRKEQREATKERQQAACAELRDERADIYTEMKERQAGERAELRELQGARERGEEIDAQRVDELTAPRVPGWTLDERVADFDRQPEATSRSDEPAAETRAGIDAPGVAREEEIAAGEEAASPVPRRDASDLASGAIGALAGLVGEEMFDLFAPPTPQQQAAAKRQAICEEQAQPVIAANRFAKYMEEAGQKAQEEHDRERKSRERERDDWEHERDD
jgi:hypothetical protein